MVDDYTNVSDIAQLLHHLNENEEEYNKYLEFKVSGVENKLLKSVLEERHWGVRDDYKKPNFVDAFECAVCRRIHHNVQLRKQGKLPKTYEAKVDHYGCPKPQRFSDKPPGSLKLVDDDERSAEWIAAKFEAQILKRALDRRKTLSQDEVEGEVETVLLDYLKRKAP